MREDETMDIGDDVSLDQLLAHVREISAYSREAGGQGELDALKYVRSVLDRWGFSTELLLHDAFISLPRSASLRVRGRQDILHLPCITHSMGASTGPDGLTGKLVLKEEGGQEGPWLAGADDVIAVVKGHASPENALAAARAGARGVVFISGPYAHEMCCSPVWGNPDHVTVRDLPAIPLLSVNRRDGERLLDALREGPLEAHLTTEVESRWTKTPILLGDLAPDGHEAERDMYVLFSGHICSWHMGAMDNGSANATMLEMGRIFSTRRQAMRRGLRLAFWSGHSQGRYSGSAWYADNHWFDIEHRCMVHLNVDSLGGMDADEFASATMPETAALGTEAVAKITGQRLKANRVGRYGDQSFLGIGVPSLFGVLSRQADGSLGWWWHTEQDTMDKLDPANVLRDAKVFAVALERLLCDPLWPFDYEASAADIRDSLQVLAQQADNRFDLREPIVLSERLASICGQLKVLTHGATDQAILEVNACLRDLGRILIPATYVATSRFQHDPAVPIRFLPKLEGVLGLAELDPESDELRFRSVALTRARNELSQALRQAVARVEPLLNQIE